MPGKKTKEEIAYAILKHRLSQGDIRASELLFRNLHKASKETGIPMEILQQFAPELAGEVIDEQTSKTTKKQK